MATGHLVNGSFSLPQPLQAKAHTASNPGGALVNVGSSAAPTTLLTWAAPVSNDAVTIDFAQRVNADGRAAHGHVREDADVHAVDDDPVGTQDGAGR